jgi:hypothetical protein
VVGRREETGRWKRLHDGTLPLEAFGARSVTDTTPVNPDFERSASEALALASALPEVQTVRCDNEYRIESPVRLDGGVAIRGGDFIVGEECFAGRADRAAFIVAAEGVRFEEVHVKGPSTHVEGPIQVIGVRRAARRFVFVNSQITRFHSVPRDEEANRESLISSAIGIYISHTGCRNFEIENSEISDLRAVGNGTVGDSNGVCVGVMVGNSRGEFDPDDPTRGVIRRCHFQSLQPVEDADGVKTQLRDGKRGLETLIEGCTFIDCAKRGVKCQAPDTRVVGNTFRAESVVTRNAVSVYRPHCTVSDNRISGKHNFGIEVDADEFVVDSNRIACEATSSELGYRDSAGIWLRSGTDGSITKNTVRGFSQSVTVHPFDGKRLGRVTISANVFDSALVNAVKCREPGDGSELHQITFSSNTAVNPGQYSVLVLDAGDGRGKYKLKLVGETIEKTGDENAQQDDKPVLMVRGADRFLAQNLSIQIDNFTSVLVAERCRRVVLSGCHVEGNGEEHRFVTISGVGDALVKDNVVPRGMEVKDTDSPNSQSVVHVNNHAW